jgi:hypothetical protein
VLKLKVRLDGFQSLFHFTGRILFPRPRIQETVVLVPWDQVEVHVIDQLAGCSKIILQQVQTFCLYTLVDRFGYSLDGQDARFQAVRINLEQCSMMLFGENKGMSPVYRTDVKKTEHQIIFVDFGAWNFASNDFAEDTICHNRPSTLV